MSKQQAINKADRLAKKTDRTFYVVWDIGDWTHEWQVTDDEGLETYHHAIHHSNIAYCTDEGF